MLSPPMEVDWDTDGGKVEQGESTTLMFADDSRDRSLD